MPSLQKYTGIIEIPCRDGQENQDYGKENGICKTVIG